MIVSLELLFQSIYGWATGPAGTVLLFTFCLLFGIVLPVIIGIAALRDPLPRR